MVALDLASLGVFSVLAAWSAARWGGPPPLDVWPWMLVAALLGVALADLGTGLVHWAADSFGSERTPILGRAVIGPFREHHRDPAAIVRHSFLEVTGNNALVVSPIVFAIGLHAPRVGESAAVAIGIAAAAGLVITAVVSNQLHRWAHMVRVPRFVAWLQRHRVILSRVEHSRHHRGAHDCGYCVANGWMNPVLDRLASPRRISGERGV